MAGCVKATWSLSREVAFVVILADLNRKTKNSKWVAMASVARACKGKGGGGPPRALPHPAQLVLLDMRLRASIAAPGTT